MKRIALLVCGMVLLLSSTAEARRNRWSGGNYTTPVQMAPAAYRMPAVTATQATMPTTATSVATVPTATTSVTPASATTAVAALTPVTTAAYSTSTAQGVANIMAASNRVGHWGGNPGYEGCGCGATPAAAYSICCYGNSGMATVDVGYARSASGMWYCCRRYR